MSEYVPVLCNDCLRLFLVSTQKYTEDNYSVSCVCGSHEVCGCEGCIETVYQLIDWHLVGCPGVFHEGLQVGIVYWSPSVGCVGFEDVSPMLIDDEPF